MRHRIKKIPNLIHNKLCKSHLLHSDKGTRRRCSLNTLFFEARSRRLPSQGRAANPRRNSGPSSKKVFTGAARTYFYNNKLGKKVKQFFGISRTSDYHSASGFGWTSPHCEENNSVTDTPLANRTRSSLEINPYSRMASRTRLTSSARLSNIPLLLSALVLLLVLGGLVFPVGANGGSEKAYAEGISTESGIDAQLVMPTSGVALEINTTLPEDNTIVEQVTGSGTKYISVNFTVGANDIDKYQVFVQADSTNLTGSTNKDVISSITTPTSGSSIGTKQWGYSVAKNHNADTSILTYNAIQTNVSTPADTVEAASGSKLTNITQAYTLAFAANLDGAKADHYKSNILLSVAANAEEVATSTEFLGFYGINYMQDMTPAICEKARVGEVARLIDKRDQKLYWIGKLADNNCWMTQNLDLDLTGKTLTPEDSDVTAAWDEASTIESAIWDNDLSSDGLAWYDPGAYVYTLGSESDTCGVGVVKSLSECTEHGWKSIEGLSASGDPSFGIGLNNNTYNAHYLAGNRYTWQIAVANSGTLTDSYAPSSICPKGWRLPYGETSGEFQELFNAYGWTWKTNENINDGRDFSNSLNITNNGINYSVVASPIYLLRGGQINSGYLNGAGFYGNYWSATPINADTSYTLYFHDDYLVPSNNVTTWKHVGLALRCVAR